jgi:hypothetical protein
LSSSFFSQTQRRRWQQLGVVAFFAAKHVGKQFLKMNRREGAYLQAFALPSHFWLPILPSSFCPFILNACFWLPLLPSPFKLSQDLTMEWSIFLQICYNC